MKDGHGKWKATPDGKGKGIRNRNRKVNRTVDQTPGEESSQSCGKATGSKGNGTWRAN